MKKEQWVEDSLKGKNLNEREKSIYDFDDIYNRISSSKNQEVRKDLFSKRDIFREHLKAKYPDFIEYVLYHKLIGSTPHSDLCYKIDFPGDDSVLKFMLDFLEKIQLKE